jgi:hypothetical protein
MAGPKRNPLDFGLDERSFVQRFLLAEILGPPRARSHRPVAPPVAPSIAPPGPPPVAPSGPPGEDPADDATRRAGRSALRKP